MDGRLYRRSLEFREIRPCVTVSRRVLVIDRATDPIDVFDKLWAKLRRTVRPA